MVILSVYLLFKVNLSFSMRIISTILVVIVAASLTGCRISSAEVDGKYDSLVDKYGKEAVNKVVKKKSARSMSQSERREYLKELKDAGKELSKETK